MKAFDFAGRIELPPGPHAAHGPRVGKPWSIASILKQFFWWAIKSQRQFKMCKGQIVSMYSEVIKGSNKNGQPAWCDPLAED